MIFLRRILGSIPGNILLPIVLVLGVCVSLASKYLGIRVNISRQIGGMLKEDVSYIKAMAKKDKDIILDHALHRYYKEVKYNPSLLFVANLIVEIINLAIIFTLLNVSGENGKGVSFLWIDNVYERIDISQRLNEGNTNAALLYLGLILLMIVLNIFLSRAQDKYVKNAFYVEGLNVDKSNGKKKADKEIVVNKNKEDMDLDELKEFKDLRLKKLRGMAISALVSFTINIFLMIALKPSKIYYLYRILFILSAIIFYNVLSKRDNVFKYSKKELNKEDFNRILYG